MTEHVERMFAEVLAQRLGLDGAETAQPTDGNQIKAALALSLMQQFRAKPQDERALTVRRVAAIVGACPMCLGVDLACAHCEGEGRPGSRMPDKNALLEWIGPSVQRLGLRISTVRKTSTRRSQPSGG